MNKLLTLNCLAIETAIEPSSLAIFKDSNLVATWRVPADISSSEDLMPAISSMLHENRIKWESINLIGVSNGPGSFTGLRVGGATAKGLALLNKTVSIGISTLEALAAAAKAGKVRSLIASGREHLFYQDFYVETPLVLKKIGDIHYEKVQLVVEDTNKSDVETVIYSYDLQQKHEQLKALNKLKIHPENLAEYVGMLAIEKYKNGYFSEFKVFYGIEV